MEKIQNGFTPTNRKVSQGFTLIELLVVIAIIGILVTITIFGLQGARESARDARRKSDLETIRSGLELYRADCNVYPSSLNSPLRGSGSPSTCANSNTYITQIPDDPQNPTRRYSYNRTSNSTYIICTSLESPPSPSVNTSGCGSCGTSCNFAVRNP